MAVTYVSSTSAASESTATPTCAAGDRLLYAISSYDQSSTLTGPSGWDLLVPTVRSGSGAGEICIAIWTKVAESSEPSPITGGGAFYAESCAIALRGADATTALDVAAATATGFTATRTVASLTTVSDGCHLVLFSYGSGDGVSTPPTGTTQRQGWDGVNYLYTEAQTTAGATGTRNHAQGGTTGWATIFLAIKPTGAAAASSPPASRRMPLALLAM